MKRSNKKSRQTKAANTSVSPQRFRLILYIAASAIALAGLGETTYLTVMHLTGQTLTCFASSGCSAVLSSKYASVGGLPTAGFGAVGYFAAFSAAILAIFGYDRARVMFALTIAVMFFATCWFLYLQAFVLRAFCDYCLMSAAFVFALAGLAVAVPPGSLPTRFNE